MITSWKQYMVTFDCWEGFCETAKVLEENKHLRLLMPGVHPLLAQAQLDAVISQRDELDEELQTWERTIDAQYAHMKNLDHHV